MKFSVIIPVYNVAQYLRECLDSVCKAVQELESRVGIGERIDPPPVEVICVDDGSTDESGAILDEYKEQGEKMGGQQFVVIHQPNRGVSAARNAGIEAATGEYLVFVDGDDAVVSWMFESLSESICRSSDSDFIMFRAQHVHGMAEPLPKRSGVKEAFSTLSIDSVQNARKAYDLVNGVLLAWGGCHRRESLRGILFQPYPNGEDALFGYTCLCHAKKIAFLNMELYRYRLPRAGSANGVTLRNLRSCCEIQKDYLRVSREWKFGGAVADIARRKFRSSLYAIKYRIVLNVPSDERVMAWSILRDHLHEWLNQVRHGSFTWDRFVCALAVRGGGRPAFHILGYWPFKLRVMLLRLPVVRYAKDVIRRRRHR